MQVERKVTSDWYAVRPIPDPQNKTIGFELVSGRKNKNGILTSDGEI